MLRPEVDINAQRKAEGINIDRGPQQTLNTENLWLNDIIIHSKFILSPFISLFSTIIPIFSPSFSHLYKDNTRKSATEITHAAHVNQVSNSHVLKFTGKCVRFFVILHDKLMNRDSKMRGTVRA